MKTKRRTSPRHPFRWKTKTNNGGEKIHTGWATVKQPKRIVHLPLTAEHVRQSIKLKGVGNTQTCTMAVCAQRNANLFGHPVEGTIDWFDSRAYVVSECSKTTGLPTECYVYAHRDDIAKLNDTKHGQRELLAQLERGGDRIITLRPLQRTNRSRTGGSGVVRDGSRSGRLTGAKLRYARSQPGVA